MSTFVDFCQPHLRHSATPGHPDFKTIYADDTPFHAILSYTGAATASQDALLDDLELSPTTSYKRSTRRERSLRSMALHSCVSIDTCCIAIQAAPTC